MAVGKGTTCICQDSTVVRVTVKVRLMCGTTCTCRTWAPGIHAAGICVSLYLPGVSKFQVWAQDFSWRCTKIIFWLMVEVTTQTACAILVVIRYPDGYIGMCIICNNQSKSCTDYNRKTWLIDLNGAIVEAEWCCCKGSIHLEAQWN